MDRENVEKGSVVEEMDMAELDSARYVYATQAVTVNNGPYSFELSLGDGKEPILFDAKIMESFRDKVVESVKDWKDKGWDNE